MLFGREIRRARFDSHLLLVCGIPFDLERGNVFGAFWQLFHYQLPGRIGLNILVADYANVNLTSFYILLRNGGGLVLPMDKFHSLREFFIIVYYGSLRNAYRTFFANRFDQQRKL